jgi:hypothetical protein
MNEEKPQKDENGRKMIKKETEIKVGTTGYEICHTKGRKNIRN